MIEVCKTINLKYNVCTTVALGFNKDSKTRGNKKSAYADYIYSGFESIYFYYLAF